MLESGTSSKKINELVNQTSNTLGVMNNLKTMQNETSSGFQRAIAIANFVATILGK